MARTAVTSERADAPIPGDAAAPYGPARARFGQRAKPRRPGRFMRVVFAALRLFFATGVFFVFLVVASYFAFSTFIRGEEIDAPDLTARHVTDALEIAKKWNLSLILDREEASEALAQGEILSQDPPAGSRIKTRSPIRVVVSSGRRLASVPREILGATQIQAGIRLRELGLDVGNVAVVPGAGQPGDTVLACDPPPETGVPPGTKVNLLIAGEAEAQTFAMPDLYGLTAAQAAQELERAGLKIGASREEYLAGVSAGTIHAQTPKAGTPVAPGTEIEIVVAPQF